MTRHSDLLEAQAFNRRRLLGVLVTGAPAGRETDPPRGVRPLVGGIVLGIALLVVTAVWELLG